MKSKKILISGNGVYGGYPTSLSNGFNELGWTVELFDDIKVYSESNKKYIFHKYINRICWQILSKPVRKEFIKKTIEFSPDLIIVIKGFYYQLKTIELIKKILPNCKIFHINPDNSFNTWHFGNSNSWIRESIPAFDAHLTWGKFLVDMLKKAGGKNIFYIPFGCDEELHFLPAQNSNINDYICDIGFIGTWDSEREEWLSRLVDLDLKIWGNSWEKANAVLRSKWQKNHPSGLEYSKICQRIKINLNLIRMQNLTAHNMRTFEIPASGGFVLSYRTQEVCEFFEENVDIACFDSPEELRNKIYSYLNNNQLRKIMINSAQEKVLTKHTYTVRAKAIEEIFTESIDLN